MERLSFYYDTSLSFSEPIHEHSFLLRCVPPDLPEQRIIEYKLEILPMAGSGRYGTDSFGNRTYAGRMATGHRFFRYTAYGIALRDDTRKEKAPFLPCFRYPSRLTGATERMKNFLAELPLVGDDLMKAKVLAKAVHRHFVYTPGATAVTTTAGEAFALGKGVCQDYTHVFLALARCLGIPARYVSGLPRGEGASHAWAEIWQDGLWYGVDPTRDCPVDEGYLKLCTGRDFGDCPVESGIFSGAASQRQDVYMKVSPQEQ